MKIEAVDFFYLSIPLVLDIGDGSQDALLVRVRAGDYEGWGECEAAPLVSIASYICPMSHSACKPIQASVLGQKLETVEDIARIGDLVRANSMDLLQADHTLSGIDMALWDLLGKKLGEPVYKLLGYKQAYPKLPYASVLFGDTPQVTFSKAQRITTQGYRAAKFGWGPFGRGAVEADREQIVAARQGLGADVMLMVDAGTVWGEDVERAAQCLDVLEECGAVWLEEPFAPGALHAFQQLSTQCQGIKLAGGEECHNFYMARQMVDAAGIGFIQIDAGRVGGISIAKRIADYAQARKVTYVNHTFTTHLALSASLQSYAGIQEDVLCEYPLEATPMAAQLTEEHLVPDANGEIQVPDAPGLGITPRLNIMRQYLVDVEIKVQGQVLYRTPELA